MQNATSIGEGQRQIRMEDEMKVGRSKIDLSLGDHLSPEGLGDREHRMTPEDPVERSLRQRRAMQHDEDRRREILWEALQDFAQRSEAAS